MGGSYLEEIVKKYKDSKGIKFRYVTCFEVCNGDIPAPVIKIDNKYIGNMNNEKLENIINDFLKNGDE
jgi:NADH:ubiquinone oxidoreductase subunit E